MRIALAIRPQRPIIRPMSSSETCSWRVRLWPLPISRTRTCSGWSERDFAMYSTRSRIMANGSRLSRWLGLGACISNRHWRATLLQHFKFLERFVSLQEARDRFRRLCPLLKPVQRTRLVQHKRWRLGARVIMANVLNERAIARLFFVGHHDAVGRLLLCADAAQAYLHCHAISS